MTVTNPIELKLDELDTTGKMISSCSFKLDHIYGTETSQSQIFEEFEDLIKSSLQGHNCSLLAVGQSGSGKTYSLEGQIKDPEAQGIITRSILLLFREINILKEQGWNLEISVCFIEIDEEIKDLFQFDTVGHTEHRAPDIKTDDKMKRVYITEVTTMKIKDPEEVHSLLSTVMERKANKNNNPATNQKK